MAEAAVLARWRSPLAKSIVVAMDSVRLGKIGLKKGWRRRCSERACLFDRTLLNLVLILLIVGTTHP